MTSRFSLSNLKQRDIALIVFVLTLLIALAWWFYLYQPAQARITDLESEISRLDVEIARGEAARRSLPELRLAVAQLEQDRLDFLAQLPQRESQIAELIIQLQEAARGHNVIIESLNRGSGTGVDVTGVRPVDFSLSITGSYANTMAFLQELEALRRFTTINQVGLSVNRTDTAEPDLTSNFAFTIYVFMGQDPGSQ